MGWTGNYIGSNFSYADEKKIIQDLFVWTDQSELTGSLVQLSKQGSTWYAAVKYLPADPNKFADHPYYLADPADGSITWAAVILTSRSGSEFMYKDLEESMGPYECSAPISLVNKLSPLKEGADGCANNVRSWRDNCVAKQAQQKALRSLKDGDVISLADAVSFPGLGRLRVFKKVSAFGRGVYRGYRSVADVARDFPVGFCRLTPRDLLSCGFEKLSPGSLTPNQEV